MHPQKIIFLLCFLTLITDKKALSPTKRTVKTPESKEQIWEEHKKTLIQK